MMENRKYMRYFWLFLFLLLGAVGIIFRASLIRSSKLVASFLQSPEENLNFTQGRTNVLLLGFGGSQRPGDDLTDTIIFASIDVKSGDTVLLSIPRDIWLETLRAKINTAYHYGEQRQKGGGFLLARQAVEEVVVGQQIHYSFLLDFESFTKAIDLVGGISLKIDQTFDDYRYPITGKENDLCQEDPEFKCRYEHLHFDAGWQAMDGVTALKFVRSRNATGEEGTDFARSARQQKVLLALKEKVISAKILTNPEKLKGLIAIGKTYIKTDPSLSDAELAAFANLLWRFIRQQSTMRTLTLDTGSEDSPGFLVNPPISAKYDQQWVLVPRAGDWQQFQAYFKEKISNGY